MNSLNLISSRVIGQSSKPNRARPRSRSQGDISPPPDLRGASGIHRSYSEHNIHLDDASEKSYDGTSHSTEDVDVVDHTLDDEKTPLLHETPDSGPPATRSAFGSIAQRVFDAIAQTIRFILSTLAAPGLYAAQCFRDDDGRYSPAVPVRKLRRSMMISTSANKMETADGGANRASTLGRRRGSARRLRNHSSRDSFASSTSESEGDRRTVKALTASKHRPSKSKGETADKEAEEEGTPRRSIRIKLHDEDALKRQKQRRSQSTDPGQPLHSSVARVQGTLNPDSLKSPTSPSVHKITKYPHSPIPPRPLIPPRLPSYAAAPRNSKIPQKTLVLDLDETLIHSLAKGGRMSSGHMVEVKLATPMTTALTPGGPPTTLGPQHPILYYVHKRPHCDEFLRKVCKWYKLVVFTASVQEYADPVIDWLEQERKFFQARYYRQHCTFRNGAYIKDLSSVEPDLSKVMILDNSPMSYIFHEGILPSPLRLRRLQR